MKCDDDTKGQKNYSQRFLQPILKQRSQPATPHSISRKFDSSNLQNLMTSPNHPDMNSQMLTELDTSDEEIPGCVDDPFDLP